MYQSGYTGITTLSKKLPFMGGFCKWYYTPRENIAAWPEIDPATQFLRNEPTLIEGAGWYGPVKVPNYTLGYTEPISRDKPGISYKQTVTGVYPGDSATSRINLENMAWHEFIVVGKMRAGGLFMILGTPEGGMQFDAAYDAGNGQNNAAAKFTFTLNSLYKGLVLPVFAGENTIAPPDGGGTASGGSLGGVTATGNDYQIIYFNNETGIDIPWTADLKTRFGIFPVIEVWFTVAGITSLANIPITVDAQPPNATVFTINFGGKVSGFVIIK